MGLGWTGVLILTDQPCTPPRHFVLLPCWWSAQLTLDAPGMSIDIFPMTVGLTFPVSHWPPHGTGMT